jgi:hypothetical protein
MPGCNCNICQALRAGPRTRRPRTEFFFGDVDGPRVERDALREMTDDESEESVTENVAPDALLRLMGPDEGIPATVVGEIFEWQAQDFKVVGAARTTPTSRRFVVLATHLKTGRQERFPPREIAELFRASSGPRSRGGTPRRRAPRRRR